MAFRRDRESHPENVCRRQDQLKDSCVHVKLALMGFVTPCRHELRPSADRPVGMFLKELLGGYSGPRSGTTKPPSKAGTAWNLSQKAQQPEDSQAGTPVP